MADRGGHTASSHRHRENRSSSWERLEKEMSYCDRIYTTISDLNRDIVLVCFFLFTVLVIMVKVHGVYIALLCFFSFGLLLGYPIYRQEKKEESMK